MVLQLNKQVPDGQILTDIGCTVPIISHRFSDNNRAQKLTYWLDTLQVYGAAHVVGPVKLQVHYLV